jgi:hypothetical protein
MEIVLAKYDLVYRTRLKQFYFLPTEGSKNTFVLSCVVGLLEASASPYTAMARAFMSTQPVK